jgi:hypothetical protein
MCLAVSEVTDGKSPMASHRWQVTDRHGRLAPWRASAYNWLGVLLNVFSRDQLLRSGSPLPVCLAYVFCHGKNTTKKSLRNKKKSFRQHPQSSVGTAEEVRRFDEGQALPGKGAGYSEAPPLNFQWFCEPHYTWWC